MNKIKIIEIKAKQWFDKANGNSYFSARIIIDGKQAAILPFQYGYSDHYVDMANQWLINNEVVKGERHENGSFPSLWQYCRDNDIILSTSKQENCLKRDLDKRE